MSRVTLQINGESHSLVVPDDEPLLDTLRERCGLTGTHQGCDTAQCGACTVLVNGMAIKSCNRLTVQSDGSSVQTIEGVALGTELHPLQLALSRHHGLQCGFCTPGVVMRALAMVDEDVPAKPDAVRHALSGNLCRCTGYEGIVSAMCDALPVLRASRQDTAHRDASPSPRDAGAPAVDGAVMVGSNSPGQSSRFNADPLHARSPGCVALRPSSLESAIQTLRANPDARPLAGGQSLLPAIRLGLAAPTHLVDLQGLPELRAIRVDAGQLRIGAMVSHAVVAAHPEVRAHWPMLGRLAGGIADAQVRAVGTIGGSLANHDPAACWPAGALACGATIITSHRQLPADEFFTGLFGTALEPGELITAVAFPPLSDGCYLKFEQPASRFALVGVAVVLRADSAVRVAVTGLGSGVMRWPDPEAMLASRFTVEALHDLRLDHSLASGDLHAPAQYRAHLAAVLLRRAVRSMTELAHPVTTSPGESA